MITLDLVAFITDFWNRRSHCKSSKGKLPQSGNGHKNCKSSFVSYNAAGGTEGDWTYSKCSTTKDELKKIMAIMQ